MVPCFGHLVSELWKWFSAFHQMATNNDSFATDHIVVWYLQRSSLWNLDVLLVTIDYSNKKQKFSLRYYNDMSLYVIVYYTS